MIGRPAAALDPIDLWSAPLSTSGLSATGGATGLVLAALVLFGVALALAVLVTYHCVQGYRRTGRRPMLTLAIGLFLLSAAPMFVRLLASNVDVTTVAARRLLVALLELCGLLVLLYTVYES